MTGWQPGQRCGRLSGQAAGKSEKLIAAVPVGAGESVRLLADYADEVIVLRLPRDLQAIGQFYRHFDQASDQEVMAILKEARGYEL